MVVQLVSFPDDDPESPGMDSYVFDGEELCRWERANPPGWVGFVTHLMELRNQAETKD